MQFRCLLAGAAGVAAALCAAGCGGDGGAVPVTTAVDRTSGTSSTTAAGEGTTTSAPDFETEVKLAALELIALRNEVFMNPDPARVGEYIADTCVCLERERRIVADLAAAGRRWTGPAIEPLGIRLTANDEYGIDLLLVARQPVGSITGPSGSSPVPEVSFAPFRVSLAEEPNGLRLNDIQAVTIEQALADEVIAEGLP